MDKLKSAIADKVLEISSSNADDVKSKLEKINRFRDFSDACRSLISRYPTIEDELLRMIENNDFDTKIASSRVDSIIRLSEENSTSTVEKEKIEEDISKLDEIAESMSVMDGEFAPADKKGTPVDEIEKEDRPSPISNQREKQIIDQSKSVESKKYLPEDIEYEEVIDDKEYVDFEEIHENRQDTPITSERSILLSTATSIKEKPLDSEPSLEPHYKEVQINTGSSIKKQTGTTTETAKKGFQTIIILAIIILLIFIIVFVIRNLSDVLFGLGVTVVVGGIIWFLIKKNKRNSAE